MPINVDSQVVLISSGNEPTTANLNDGEIAFGKVDGKMKLYGGFDGTVEELLANYAQPMYYFPDQNSLNDYLASSEVPEGGWYAAVAEDSNSKLSATAEDA